MRLRTAMAGILGALTLAVMPVTAATPDVAAVLACEPGQACETSLPVRVVIVSLFEIGEDEGDVPGEFQLWKERRGLDTRIPFPQSYHDLWYNPETQVLGVVTGIGTARSATATMALGLDQRFDLTQAYWLVAGIAGIDPEDVGADGISVAGDAARPSKFGKLTRDLSHRFVL